MRKVKLLQSYQGHGTGEIISVSNNVAFGLIDSGKAISTTVRDFLVESEIGKTKALDTNKLSTRDIRRRKKRR